MKKMMRQLRQPGPGPLNDLAQAMQRGDFAGAKEALDKLAQQLGNNELNDQQRAQLAKRFGDDSEFSFRVVVEDGKAKVKARKVSAA